MGVYRFTHVPRTWFEAFVMAWRLVRSGEKARREGNHQLVICKKGMP